MPVRFTTVEALEEALTPQEFRCEPLPWAAALTRDVGRYHTYFPTVAHIAPNA